jgi:hypothetical protein
MASLAYSELTKGEATSYDLEYRKRNRQMHQRANGCTVNVTQVTSSHLLNFIFLVVECMRAVDEVLAASQGRSKDAQLNQLLRDRIDGKLVASCGHSFGAATAVLTQVCLCLDA